MKKIVGVVLILCLVFTFAAEAFAAGKPVITKQPETSTTSKKGAVSFSISVKGTVSSYTWYFINPENGEKISGKKLSSVVKGVKVNNPNSKKITLSHVPESMHGWSVYCHVNGNGYKIDSDTVTLLVYGMETAADSSVSSDDKKVETEPADEEKKKETASSEKEKKKDTSAADNGKKDTDGKSTESAEKTADADPAVSGDGDLGEGADDEMPERSSKTITVTAPSKVLLKLDTKGNIVDNTPVSSLEFINTGSFCVKAEGPIRSWTINGVRFEPAQPVNEFKVMNVTDNIALDLKIYRATDADAQVDESKMCKVTCKGCTFTYLRGGIRSATSGEVPSGAPIRVIADSSDLAAAGYSINGGNTENAGKASFMLTVSDDVEIVAGK